MKKNSIVFIVIVLALFVGIMQIFRSGAFGAGNSFEQTTEGFDYLVNMEYLSEDEFKLFDKEQVYFLTNKDAYVNKSVKQLFEYIDIPLKIKKTEGLYPKKEINYDDYSMVIINVEFQEEDECSKLISYVENGGKVIYMYQAGASMENAFIKNAGFLDEHDEHLIEGFIPVRGYITGIDSQVVIDDFEYGDTSYVSIADDTKVYVKDVNDNPLFFTREQGKGIIGCVNVYPYDEDKMQSMILGAIEVVSDILVYPTINSMVVFVDDFPANFTGNSDIVENYYGVSEKRFVYDIWWPDIVETILKNDIKYTCAYIASYNNEVESDFEDHLLVDEDLLLTYGSEILKYGGEISFHGYNHQSLLFNQNISDKFGYKAWSNNASMAEAISVAKAHFSNSFPEYDFLTYVPPSNMFSGRSREPLNDTIDTLKVYSGVMSGHEKGLMRQIFEVDDDGIVNLPRVSSGTYVGELERAAVKSIQHVNGAIVHFIHPDDFYDVERGHGLSWPELYDEYNDFLDEITTTYWWLDKQTASQAGERVYKYDKVDVYSVIEDGVLTIGCDGFIDEQHLIVNSKEEIRAIENCRVEQIDVDRYLVIATDKICSLEVN